MKGYTIIELVIGIAVIFALAIVTIILVNPHELILQKRDALRKKEVVVLGEALISYAKSKNGVVPQGSISWISDLEIRGEISKVPAITVYDTPSAVCKLNQQNQFCYTTDGKRPPTSGVIYTKLESEKENTKCNASLGETAYAVYDMLSVRGGVVCTVGVEPRYNSEGQRFQD